MHKKDCFLVGTVFKLHGYRGDVNIYNNHNILFNFNIINYFLINQNNTLVPYFINQARHTKNHIILVNFEDVNSEKDANNILKKEAYLPIDLIPENAKKKISAKQIIGFKVIDINLGELGEIIHINQQTAQQLIFVSKRGKEFSFPMHNKFVKEIDILSGIMKVEIPKELLNLN